ncbi:hypothetical protein J6590_043231 [Homalodisca vitripennis]|nr:hypothetical protein J6590_043231 [Homalodisca vitripennis]
MEVYEQVEEVNACDDVTCMEVYEQVEVGNLIQRPLTSVAAAAASTTVDLVLDTEFRS